jgi:hypothetical protein
LTPAAIVDRARIGERGVGTSRRVVEGYVILRIVRGAIAPGGLDAVAAGFAGAYPARARGVPGLVRFHAGVRPEGEGHALALVTFWTSVDAALEAFDGDLDAPRALIDVGPVVTLSGVAYFEVDESQLRRSPSDPVGLRLAVGRVHQGLDASLQQELRRRLHELDADVTEAHVARRIVGTDVEVAFVSAWARMPAGRSLDEPIWPDIASRYDWFGAETFDLLATGPSAA